MRCCNICNVAIENKTDYCPLCKKRVVKKSNIESKDFPVQNISKTDINKFVLRVLLFTFITLIGLNIVLNLIFQFNSIWVPYAIIILFYVYLIIRASIISYRDIGTIIVLNVYMLSFIGFILDMLLGYRGWSISYLLPILILIGDISLVIFMIVKPYSFKNYFIYILTVAFFGIIQLLFLTIGIIKYRTISLIAFFVSVLTVIGLFIFGSKKARGEFIKRFHY